MITTIIIGQTIRRERRARGLSQQAVGQYLGVSFQQLQKYERGTNRISAAHLYRLAQLYGCSMERLCGGEPAQEIIKSPPAIMASGDAKPLLSDFYRISSSTTRKQICAIVRTIAELNG